MRHLLTMMIAATALATVTACDSKASAQDAQKPAPRSFSVETTTRCTAGTTRSTETGRSTVTIAGRTITLGAEDEALAGIALPCAIRDGRISITPGRVPTGELFGEIELSRFEGELHARRLTLSYTFSALDVTCTVSGEGPEI